MKDLITLKFTIDAYSHFTIIDEQNDRWNGENDPYLVILCIDSKGKDINIVEFEIKDIDNVDIYQIIQVDDNTTEDELRAFLVENHQYIKELLDYKLDDPDWNGEL